MRSEKYQRNEVRAEKKRLNQDIQALLTRSSGVFLVMYKGMKVSEFGELRKGLPALDAACHVVPNLILQHAAAELGIRELAEMELTGETALVTGGKDPAKSAKYLKGFRKNHPALTVKFGILERKLISAQAVETLADLPPREVLLARFLGVLEAPKRQLVTVLNAKAASVLYVLLAYINKKEKAA